MVSRTYFFPTTVLSIGKARSYQYLIASFPHAIISIIILPHPSLRCIGTPRLFVHLSGEGDAAYLQHKLSKVRVVLEGDKKNDVTDVKIKTYTSCTLNTDGTSVTGLKTSVLSVAGLCE